MFMMLSCVCVKTMNVDSFLAALSSGVMLQYCHLCYFYQVGKID